MERSGRLLLLIVAFLPVHAISGIVDSTHAGLSVDTPGARAMIIVDSSFSGYAPWEMDSLSPGRHLLHIVPLPVSRWSSSPLLDTITLAAGETRHLLYRLSPGVRLSSLPSGAIVYLHRSALGHTPFAIDPGSVGRGDTIVLEKKGYQPAKIIRFDTLWGDSLVPLLKDWTPFEQEGEVRPFSAIGDRPAIQLWAPALGSILAGTVSAYCKIHADDVNSQYLISGDAGLKSEVRRYDLVSAIALVVMEAGIALLAYYLLGP